MCVWNLKEKRSWREMSRRERIWKERRERDKCLDWVMKLERQRGGGGQEAIQVLFQASSWVPSIHLDVPSNAREATIIYHLEEKRLQKLYVGLKKIICRLQHFILCKNHIGSCKFGPGSYFIVKINLKEYF